MALPKRHRGTEADRNCKLRTLQNAPSWKRTLGCPCEQPRRRVLRNRAGPSAVLNKKTRTSLVLNASLKSSQNLDTQCVEIPVPDNSISRLDDSIHFLPLAPKPISCIPPTSDWSFRVARRHISIILKHFRRFYLQHLKPAKSRNARKQTRSEPESLYQPKSLTRRNVTAVTGSFLTAILVLPLESAAVHSGNRASLVGPPRELHIPLQYRDNVYCLLYTIDGKFFRGVVDTGSPFLTVSPDNCKEWGCWRGEGVATDLTDTWERYAAQVLSLKDSKKTHSVIALNYFSSFTSVIGTRELVCTVLVTCCSLAVVPLSLTGLGRAIRRDCACVLCHRISRIYVV
uniref:Uncharacterized protein n=1 Tax=Tetraselmis sp. GSL018 TaxID=582737 RepID=A0A061R0I1_9CHLO